MTLKKKQWKEIETETRVSNKNYIHHHFHIVSQTFWIDSHQHLPSPLLWIWSYQSNEVKRFFRGMLWQLWCDGSDLEDGSDDFMPLVPLCRIADGITSALKFSPSEHFRFSSIFISHWFDLEFDVQKNSRPKIHFS